MDLGKIWFSEYSTNKVNIIFDRKPIIDITSLIFSDLTFSGHEDMEISTNSYVFSMNLKTDSVCLF